MATTYHNQIDRNIYDNFDLNEEILKNLVFNDETSNEKSAHQIKKSRRPKNRNENQSNKRTSRLDSSVSLTKLVLLKTIDVDFDVVPDYLSKRNPSFETQIRSLLPSTTTLATISVEQLRKVAILMYNITCLDLVRSLWISYRKSGTGELRSTVSIASQVDTSVWPKEVQSYMKLSKFELEKNEENASLTFVNHCLCQLDDQREQYRQKLHMEKSHLVSFSFSSECIIAKFVKEGLSYQRLVIDRESALVLYDYTDRLLHRAYLAQKPSQRQIEIYQHLSELKSDHEMTKHEANFLKQNISVYLASHSFEKAPIAQLSLIDDVQDPIRRQQLYKQYKETAEQARMDMIKVSLECAEGQKKRCQQQYDAEFGQMWNAEKTLPSDQKLTPSMRTLIDQCSINMTARIECLYKFKTQLFQIKANVK